MKPSIAIAISTRNRPKEFWFCFKMIRQFTRFNCDIFVVDDASDQTYVLADYKFNERSGISRSKNKCLDILHKAYHNGVKHFFLFDDDTYPIKFGWQDFYINSGAHHLSYSFTKPIRQDDKFKYHHYPNGCMLYFTRECIDTVGGFDTQFNNKYEHTELSRRIYNAGLTAHPAMDLVGSSEYIYCMDQDNAIHRSFSDKEMKQSLKEGYAHFEETKFRKEFIEFRS